MICSFEVQIIILYCTLVRCKRSANEQLRVIKYGMVVKPVLLTLCKVSNTPSPKFPPSITLSETFIKQTPSGEHRHLKSG